MAQHVHHEHTTELLQKLQSLLRVGRFCDVVLIAGKNGQRVSGHRVILAACSPYFAELFTDESKATEVTLGDDVHGDFLLPLVHFCYTGKIEICAETVDELAQTASRLQLNAVVSGCSQFMEHHLDASNCLGFAATAERCSLIRLKHEADQYASKHFVEVSRQEEFLKLNANRLKVLIGKDDLNVRREEAVFHGVKAWLNYDMDEEGRRAKHAAPLLALVRLSLLSTTFLTDHLWDLCHKHPVCQELLKKAFWEADLPISARSVKARKPLQTSLLALWYDENNFNISKYSFVEDKWNLLNQDLPSTAFFAAAVLKNELITVGGIDGDMYDSVDSINLDTMELSILPSLTLGRYQHEVAVLDGLLYAVGGTSQELDYVMDSVERYDPNDCTWSDVAPLNVARYGFGLAVLNSRLFAVGGINESGSKLCSTECFDPELDKWTPLGALNEPRFALGLAAGNGFLYAVGGSAIDSIERYDPQADKWTEIFSASFPPSLGRCVFLENCLFILSTNNDDRKISLQEYNIKTGELTQRAMLGSCLFEAILVLK